MRQIQWLLPLLLISEVIFVNASPLIAASPAIAAQKQSKRQSALDAFKDLFKPKPRTGASRGPGCIVTPGLVTSQLDEQPNPELDEEPMIWSDRPLFVWDEAIGRIEVSLADDGTVVWSQSVPANARSILYAGQPLQAGQTYKVRLLDLTNTPIIQDSAFDLKFMLVASQRQQEIAGTLANQEKQLRQQKATEETIALQKAIYFAEQKLWSDAFQTVYAISATSPELKTFVQTTIAKICPKTP
jgi:hypothetical protein